MPVPLCQQSPHYLERQLYHPVWLCKTHHCHSLRLGGVWLLLHQIPPLGWSYHLNCLCSRERGLLTIEVNVHHGLWLGSQVLGLLSFSKVYLGFFLDSKLDGVIIGRPLVCGLTINQMGHPSLQLRIHALKEAIDQQSPLLFRGTS